MNELMQRRRALMTLRKDWDFSWNYTAGVTPDQVGWTRLLVDGSPKIETLQDNGLLLVGCYYINELPVSNGVLEVKLSIRNSEPSTNRSRAAIRFGSSATDSLNIEFRTSSGSRRINLVDNSSTTSRTRLGSWEWETDYVIRMTIQNGVGTVELDGTVLKAGIDTGTMYGGGLFRCGNISDAANGGGCFLQSIQYKKL